MDIKIKIDLSIYKNWVQSQKDIIWRQIVLLIFSLIVFSYSVNSQDLLKTKERIARLSSVELCGRGYLDNCAAKTAEYLADEFDKAGLIPFGDSFFQSFYYSVNTFPNDIELKIDGTNFIAGTDFLIGPSSPSVKRKYRVFKPDSLLLNDPNLLLKKVSENKKLLKRLLVIDYALLNDIDKKWFYIFLMKSNKPGFAGFIELIPETDELMWAVRRNQKDYPIVKIKRELFPDDAKKLYINCEPELIEKFHAKNVIAQISGKKEEYVVFTAHYDHLGRMGNVYFPGAQDNASGTAMVLDLADYYAKNRSDYSIVFMLFFGEEAGLLGSRHYVENPMFDLDKIKILINLDMVGTGEKGITIVNGSAESYDDIFTLFNNINYEDKLLPDIVARGEAPNSDHAPFHEKGVKSVFIYSMGGTTYYHSIKDRPETLTFSGYFGLFELLTKFVRLYE